MIVCLVLPFLLKIGHRSPVLHRCVMVNFESHVFVVLTPFILGLCLLELLEVLRHQLEFDELIGGQL